MNFLQDKKVMDVSRGFSLVELLVSLSIFSIVMLVSTGTLLIMIDINAKAQAVYSSATNLTFALDSITREIRTGYDYFCANTYAAGGVMSLQEGSRDCNNNNQGDYIAFTRERDEVRTAYRFVQDASGGIPGRIEANEGNGWIPLTSDDVVIETFELVVVGTESFYDNDSDDVVQPYTDLFIKGYVNNGLDNDTDFSIQSHIIQRRLDII